MKITITLPRAFETKLKALLKRLEIPESEIAENLPGYALSDSLLNDHCLWTNFYVYPDRATAERVADRLRKAGKSTYGLSCFESGRRVEIESPANANESEGLEHFTIALTPELARRLRYVATEQDTSPRSLIAEATIRETYAFLMDSTFTQGDCNDECAAARKLNGATVAA